jgi:hypothetical protein
VGKKAFGRHLLPHPEDYLLKLVKWETLGRYSVITRVGEYRIMA